MSSYRVVAIPSEVAEQVRNTGKSPNYGFPAHREVAAGRAPCRHCLKLIRKDEEELLLFTYDPFRELGEPPLPGQRAAEELFGEAKIRYVNVRSTEAGCFLFRLERG